MPAFAGHNPQVSAAVRLWIMVLEAPVKKYAVKHPKTQSQPNLTVKTQYRLLTARGFYVRFRLSGTGENVGIIVGKIFINIFFL